MLRPPDDPDLPDVWGLPAGRVGPGEAPEAAATRVAMEKLGIRVTGLVPLRRGTADRSGYRLEMELFGGRIGSGTPEVPQPGEGVTRYAAWRWAHPDLFEPAARQGSLCCRLFIQSREHESQTRPR